MRQLTQKQRILDALLKKQKLSKRDMLTRFGVWNSGHIIMLLRRSGHAIKTEFKQKGVVRFAIYSLER